MLSYLGEFAPEIVEIWEVNRKGIAGEAKPGSAIHVVSPVRCNRDSQAESQGIIRDTEMGGQLY